MSLFSEILNVHNDSLALKGYDRQSLSLTRLQEDLPVLLRNQFETIIRENLWSAQPQKFSVSITGHFGRHNQDAVDFVFGYQYDPRRIRLDLQTLSASMKGQAHTWLITNKTYLLPRSTTVYEQLEQKLQHTSVQPDLDEPMENSQKVRGPKR
jgi:hypothetical protein